MRKSSSISVTRKRVYNAFMCSQPADSFVVENAENLIRVLFDDPEELDAFEAKVKEVLPWLDSVFGWEYF